MVQADAYKKAVFAGGCFWCMEPPYDKLEGVIDVISGYTGGHLDNPTYKDVTRGGTGHFEAIEVTYDPNVISYEALLETYWRNIDPLDGSGQFCDKGESYKSAIFYGNDMEKTSAENSKKDLIASGLLAGDIQTQILPAKTFFKAEDYHQDYYQKNPVRYKYYRYSCGRDKRLKELWGTTEKN